MSLQLPPGDFRAYLFDCDGTIADSMPLHFRAWNEALALWKAEFPKDLFLAWAGIPVPRTVEMLNEKFRLSLPVREVVEAREQKYLELLPQVGFVAGVKKVIEGAHGKIPLAVVSGSPRSSVIRTLSFLGVKDRFQAIVGAEDTPRGKPHPDPYLRAAELLGASPSHCLVFEDADLGIEAANAAGMGWVRVISSI